MIFKMQGDNAEELQQRLISWRITDDNGTISDRASLTFHADGLSFIPASGSEYSFWVQGEARGKWQVSAITEHFEPNKLEVQLSPAKFTTKDPTAWREPRKRTFPPATVGDVVNSVMSSHGYTVRVDPELANVKTDHLNQTEETDVAFIVRLAKRYDAVAKPFNGLYVFGLKGNINKLTDVNKPVAKITPAILVRGTGKLAHPTSIKYAGAKASYRVSETGENAEVVVGDAPYTFIKELFISPEEARANAMVRLQELARNGQEFTATIQGTSGFWSEGVMVLEGFNNPRAKGNWSLDTVTLSGSQTSYTIQIKATRPRG